MYRIQGPGAYLQGPDLINKMGELVSPLGKKFFVVAGGTAMKRYKESIEKSIREQGLECVFARFGGQSTAAEAERLSALASEAGCGAVIGIGGGKVIDSSKLTAHRLGLPMIIVPTLASSDAPCSSLSIVYDEHGAVSDVVQLGRNPEMVIMDSRVIAQAPARMLACGMGDALATYYEARVCFENGFPNAIGSAVPLTGIGLAKLCCDTLYEHGLAALEAVERYEVTLPLERVIEANTYLSALGFECGGLSCAHDFQDAVSVLEDCHACYQGEKVAFGTLCLLAVENRPEEEQSRAMEFCRRAGLPVTLAQIGLKENAEQKLRSVAHLLCRRGAAPNSPPPGVDANMLIEAALEVDRRGRGA